MEYHLEVFENRSQLVLKDGRTVSYEEGPMVDGAKLRYRKISDALANGYLRRQIEICRENSNNLEISCLDEKSIDLLDRLISAVTSEVGRALVGLAILQLCVKSISPEQSIRLHKAGNSARNFGWKEGISMRTLDQAYITPELRANGLLKLNSFGFMMTRTLAENYPYSRVYKAAMRGGKKEWVDLVEMLESNEIKPLGALQYMLSRLLNLAESFKSLVEDVISKVDQQVLSGSFCTLDSVYGLISKHMDSSSYAARLMEISMHAFQQMLGEIGALGGNQVVPLSQMRSANKKHGNIGDVEITDGKSILESWDAKYGKNYLRDELEELIDKLEGHFELSIAGFVTSGAPERLNELSERIFEIQDATGIEIAILNYPQWIELQLGKVSGLLIPESEMANRWLRAYIESLGQMRQNIAPIDEPCMEWMEELRTLLQ